MTFNAVALLAGLQGLIGVVFLRIAVRTETCWKCAVLWASIALICVLSAGTLAHQNRVLLVADDFKWEHLR